jgi:hypothetical protein
MDSVLDGGGQLEREMRPDRLGASATGSVLLHALLFGGIVFWGVFNGFLHHNYWGNPGPGSAMQVSLDSAAIPLPSDQPKNDNVLPSETPSPAPAPPQPKAEKAVDETAIPILGKETKLDKHKQIKSEVKQPTPKQLAPSKAKQPPPKPDSRIQYGEQAGSKLARSTYAQTANANQPVSVSNGDFGTSTRWTRARPRAPWSRCTSRSTARGFRPASGWLRPAAAQRSTAPACWPRNVLTHLGICPGNRTTSGSTSLMIVRISRCCRLTDQ